jgi:succinate dehydrogenase hydrophobic anchor subunit
LGLEQGDAEYADEARVQRGQPRTRRARAQARASPMSQSGAAAGRPVLLGRNDRPDPRGQRIFRVRAVFFVLYVLCFVVMGVQPLFKHAIPRWVQALGEWCAFFLLLVYMWTFHWDVGGWHGHQYRVAVVDSPQGTLLAPTV